MSEKTLRKRLIRTTIVVVLISIALLLCGIFISNSFRSILRDTRNSQMESETQEQKTHILRQIHADFQTLYTLSGFFQFSNTMDMNSFVRGLSESNSQNDFVRMAYFEANGKGVRVTADQKIETDLSLSSIHANAISAIEQAWNGESAVSRIYYDDMLGQVIYVYSIPIYDGDTIIGALAASKDINALAEILDDKSTLSGNGFFQLIGSEGNLLVRSQSEFITDELNSIFDSTFISEEEKNAMLETMANGESGFFSLQFQENNYQLYLEPVGINGWYLLCINTSQGAASSSVSHILQVMQLTYLGILLAVIFLIIYGYRLLRRNNKALIQYAYYDSITGAYNYTRFMQEFNLRLKHTEGFSIAVMNIRQFKFINELFGKKQGDRLLRHMKDVFKESIQEGEFFCRYTADCYYIFLNDTNAGSIRARLKEMMDKICEFVFIHYNSYQIRLYCGVAVSNVYANEQLDGNEILTHALFALAKARVTSTPENYIWFYDTELHKRETLENYIESHMHRALENEEFKVYLQAKINLETQTLGGAEALVRWITEDGKMISPGDFIDLFEQNGFCVKLDMYMFEHVCQLIRSWLDQGLEAIPLSINQSKRLFYERDYVENLQQIIQAYDVPAHLITLEILEGLALENAEEVNKKIAQLHAIGFKISMDDFGSGYSSLNTLSNLAIDELKLDRAFLMAVSSGNNLRQKVIMEEIVRLAKRLNISTVVEGVETREDELLVQSLGCNYGQGYYYSRPIDAGAFEEKYLQGK